MKKTLLLAVFVISATWAFASNTPTSPGEPVTPPAIPQQEEKPCMMCAECGGITYCAVAASCVAAAGLLIDILIHSDCLDDFYPD